MSVAFLMSLIIQAASPETAALSQPQSAPTQAGETGQGTPPARSGRTRSRTEVASDCQFRARTGSIQRRTICQTPRQTAAHSAVARRYLEEVQVPQAAADINGIGPR